MYKLYIEENISGKNILSKILKREIEDDDIFYNDYGKPYLKDKSIYFNISHSNNITVCAISDKEIGIDIEKKTYKKDIVGKICNDKEKELIKDDASFTDIWVKKESYVKYLGIGLSYGLKNVDTTKLDFIIKKYKDYFISIYQKTD